MRILIIPSFFRNKYDSTLGSFFWDQAVALKKNGNEIIILFCDTYSVKEIGKLIHYSEYEEEEIKGIKIYRTKRFCPLKHSSGIFGTADEFKIAIYKLYNKYCIKEKIDIIHAHCCLWGGYAAQYLSKQTGIPYIITEHSTIYAFHPKLIKGKVKKKIKGVFSDARLTICVSEALRALVSEYSSTTEILGNVVDFDTFDIKKEKNVIVDNIKLLSICYMKDEGQLYKKGIDLLIKSFYEASKRCSNLELICGGGGKAQLKVLKWANKYNIKVNMLGALSRDEVAEAMNNCDIFILPSRYETFGVVYAEAMGCGKPIIGTKTGGPDSFVNDTNGILVKVDSSEELTDAIVYMVNNLEKYDSNRIRESVKGKFSMHSIATSLEQFYRQSIM